MYKSKYRKRFFYEIQYTGGFGDEKSIEQLAELRLNAPLDI